MSKQGLPRHEFETLQKRAKHRCEYCLSPEKFSPQNFEGDHIESESDGGATILDNMALACRGCNGHKYTKTHGIDLLTLQTERLFNPRKDVWPEHFAWGTDPSILVGLTAIGRTTIAVLKLNRPKLVNLRMELMKIAEHPPVD